MRRRRKKKVEIPKRPENRRRNGNGAEIDPKYQFFHLGWMDTQALGKNIEKEIIRNGLHAEKAITWSKCWSYRFERGKYSEKLLNSISMLFEYDGLDYLHGNWEKVPLPEQKTRRRRRRSE